MKNKKRVRETIHLLEQLQMPQGQLNDRTAITLLALLNLRNNLDWVDATNPRLTIRNILDFARKEMSVKYAENTRESIRKHSVKQLVADGVVLQNPGAPHRATNSALTCYQINPELLDLFRSFGSPVWDERLNEFLSKSETLKQKIAKVRKQSKVNVVIAKGAKIKLSPGKHSTLIKAVISEFAARFTPGAELIYVGDTGEKWGYVNADIFAELNIVLEKHGKMPDVVFYYREKKWLVIVEAVTSSGPVDALRQEELHSIFKNNKAGLVYVTAFSDRAIMRKFLDELAWETEVWCASDPTHLIHFNGIRFLGPY